MSDPRESSALAPRWHTALLVGLMLAVAATGIILTVRGEHVPEAPTHGSVAAAYLPMIIVQSCLLFYVCRLGRPHNALAALVGTRWTGPGRAVTDLVLAAGLWLLIVGSELSWKRWLAPGQGAAIAAMLPHTLPEKLGWVLVATIVGVSEEVVYRGYLRQQLGAFTRSVPLGVVLQAVLFGLAHANQGAGAVLRITCYGLFFGVLAQTRRSLVPGILCHVWTDIAAGLS